MIKNIMILGTASAVGKSTIATGICRYFTLKGYSVAPFKALNISLNSYVTKDGGEMGRAQVVQAEACGIEPEVLMNPILMKPSGNSKTQVIVNGKVYCNMDAYRYKDVNKEIVPMVMESYNKLSKEKEIIVLEGSGSCAEINLKKNDIANMAMAKAADAPVILVADIDRGGVFASVVGTLMLLDEDEKSRVKAVIINKFRGKTEYFKDGMKQLEEMINIPVLGAMPYFTLDIEDEDGVTERIKNRDKKLLDIVVIKTPYISNFTDFSPLERIEGVSLRYVSKRDEIGNPHLIIIPGSKNTINDLIFIRECGIEKEILKLNENGTMVFGICGGYQMLGEEILDPFNVEGDIKKIKAMGLLPIKTVFNKVKTTKQFNGIASNEFKECDIEGYEIHNGENEMLSFVQPFVYSMSNEILGVSIENQVYGTYIHGIFNNKEFLKLFIEKVALKSHIDMKISDKIMDYKEYNLTQYDELVKLMEKNLDMKKIEEIVLG